MFGTKEKIRAKAPARRVPRRLLYGAAALSLAAVTLGACSSAGSGSSGGSGSSAGSGSGSASGPYKIGFTSGLTGQFGAVGQGVRDGAKAYFDAVNKSGGVNGHQIQFTALDDALDPNRGVANTIQLVTQNQDIALLGFHYSVVADAVAPYAARYKVPIIAATVDATLVQPVQPYVFAVTVQTANYAGSEVALAQKLVAGHPGTTKVAILTSSNSAGNQQWENDVASIVQSLGWHIVDKLIAPQDEPNAAPAVAKVIADKPDVFITALGNDPWEIAAVKQLEQAGATFPIINYDFASWSALQSLHSPLLYDVAAIAYGTSAATPDFIRDTAAAKVSPNGIYVNKGYLEAMIVTTALKACGYPCSGQQLDAALNKVTLSTDGMIAGGVTYSSTNHQAVTFMNAFQWKANASAPTVVDTNLKVGTGS